MTGIKAFDGYIVDQDHAEEVVSPAYDSVSPEQRRLFAEANPGNFLNTMRLLDDFSEENRPSPEELLDINRRNLDALLENGSFNELSQPCLFIYQLDSGDHVQTGVVCEVAVAEYENNQIRKHENTRSDKEDLLANYQKVVGAASSPICLAYAQDDDIDAAINTLTTRKADLEFTSQDKVIQRVWCIDTSGDQNVLTQLFQKVSTTYLTDGHHRAASGRRYAEIMRAEKGNSGDEPYNQLLVALFPDDQLNLLPFHRCVRDLNGKGVEQIVEELSTHFEVEPLPGCKSFESSGHGEFGMLIGNEWFRLQIKPEFINSKDPVSSLDVSLLQDLILDPVFGIADMRSDSRLDYVAGVSGTEGIYQKQSEGWEVVFVCYATSIDQLMDVADAGGLMPPKSTYFDPKPRSGIFVRLK